MITQRISFLATLILTSGNSYAAITTGSAGTMFSPGEDSTAILVLNKNNVGSYVLDTGITAGGLASGADFNIDISPAISAFGGAFDTFALFGALGGQAQTYSYAIEDYVNEGLGVIYTQSTPGQIIQDRTQLLGFFNTINVYIDIVSNTGGEGFFFDGSPAALSSHTLLEGIYSVNVPGQPVRIWTQNQDINGNVVLTQSGASFSIFATSISTSEVPVPATVWLFGTSLIGLYGYRKNKYRGNWRST